MPLAPSERLEQLCPGLHGDYVSLLTSEGRVVRVDILRLYERWPAASMLHVRLARRGAVPVPPPMPLETPVPGESPVTPGPVGKVSYSGLESRAAFFRGDDVSQAASPVMSDDDVEEEMQAELNDDEDDMAAASAADEFTSASASRWAFDLRPHSVIAAEKRAAPPATLLPLVPVSTTSKVAARVMRVATRSRLATRRALEALEGRVTPRRPWLPASEFQQQQQKAQSNFKPRAAAESTTSELPLFVIGSLSGVDVGSARLVWCDANCVIVRACKDDGAPPQLFYATFEKDVLHSCEPLSADAHLLVSPAGGVPAYGVYLITPAHLGAFFPLFTQQALLSNVIVFEQDVADELCHSNGWDRRQLAMQALELGLTHRQLDVVAEALAGLQPDQHLSAGILVLRALWKAHVTSASSAAATGSSKAPDVKATAIAVAKAAAEAPLAALDPAAVRYAPAGHTEYTAQLVHLALAFLTGVLRSKLQAAINAGDTAIAAEVAEALLGAQGRLPDQIMKEDGPVGLAPSDVSTLLGVDEGERVPVAKDIGWFAALLSSIRWYLLLTGVRKRVAVKDVEAADGDDSASSSYTERERLRTSSAAPSALSTKDDPLDGASQRLLQSWSNLSNILVIENALRRGCLSLALGYLKRDHPAVSSATLSEIRGLSSQIIFRALCEQQAAEAVEMLRNIGADPCESLREAVLYTTDARLRSFLLSAGGSDIGGSEVVQALADLRECAEGFLAQVESTLTAREFSTEQSRLAEAGAVRHGRYMTMRAIAHSGRITSLESDVKDVEDGSEVAAVPSRKPSLPAASMSAAALPVSKYFQSPLQWVLAVSVFVRERIMAEASGFRDTDWSAADKDAVRARWQFAISRAFVSDMEQWLPTLLKSHATGGAPLPPNMLDDLAQFAPPFVQAVATSIAFACGAGPGPDSAGKLKDVVRLLARSQRLFRPTAPLWSGASGLAEVTSFVSAFAAKHGLQRVLLDFLSYSDADISDANDLLDTLVRSDAAVRETQWLEMVLRFRALARDRSDASLARLAIASLRVTLDEQHAATQVSPGARLSTAIARNRPLLVVGTLMLAGVAIRDAVLNEAAVPKEWTLSAGKRLHQALSAYPLIQAAFRLDAASGRTAQADEARRSIVKVASQSLLWADIGRAASVTDFGKDDEGFDALSRRILGDGAASLDAESSTKLDAPYYLERGQPLKAFEAARETGELLSSAALQVETAVRVAVLRLGDAAVSAACIAFLDICGLHDAAHALSVNLAVARRIAGHRARSQAGADGGRATITFGDADESPLDGDIALLVVDLEQHAHSKMDRSMWLSLKGVCQGRVAAAGALDLVVRSVFAELESATLWAAPGDRARSAGPAAWRAWDLVIEFARIHKLPPSAMMLRYGVSSGDVMMLLSLAERAGVSVPALHQLISDDFTASQAASEHMRAALESLMEPPSGRAGEAPALGARSMQVPMPPVPPSESLFDVYFACQRTADPARSLLMASIQRGRPIFAVLATTVTGKAAPQPSLEECIAAYLLAAAPRHVGDDYAWNGALVSGQTVEWRVWTLEDVASVLLSLLSARQFNVVLAALAVFDASNPLVHLVRFADRMAASDMSSMDEHLGRFVSSLATDGADDQFALGDAAWLRRFSEAAIDELLAQCPSAFERGCLLRCLVAQKLDPPRFSRLLLLHSLVEEAELATPLTTPPEQLLELLLAKQRFREARDLVAEFELSPHTVTLREVSFHVAQFKKSSLWDLEFTRMALWAQCNRLFIKHECDPSIAGDFFYRRADQVVGAEHAGDSHGGSDGESDGEDGSHLETEEAARRQQGLAERAMLLALTLKWLRGDVTRSALPLRSREVLADVQKRLWLVTIAAQGAASSGGEDGGDAFGYIRDLMPPDSLPEVAADIRLDADVEDILSAALLAAPLADVSEAATADEPKPVKATGGHFVSASFASLPAQETSSLSEFASQRTDEEVRSLDITIGRLLNAGRASQAAALATAFKHSNLDIYILRHAVRVAEGEVNFAEPLPALLTTAAAKVPSASGMSAPPAGSESSGGGLTSKLAVNERLADLAPLLVRGVFIELGNSSSSSSSLSAATAELALFDRLASMAIYARESALRVGVNWCISRMLGKTYDEIATLDAHQVLARLIRLPATRDPFRIARWHIAVNRMEPVHVAQQLAMVFFRALVGALVAANAAAAADGESYLDDASDDSVSGGLHSVDVAASGRLALPQAVKPRGSEYPGPSAASLATSTGGWWASSASLASTIRSNRPAVDAAWSPAELIPFANLTGNPALLGRALCDLVVGLSDSESAAASTSNPLFSAGDEEGTEEETAAADAAKSLGRQQLCAAEVELLIRAHYCFGLVSDMEGVERVLTVVRRRVPYYASNAYFALLVRLLMGIQRYREMQYVLDALVQHDMFELVLRKTVDKDGQWDLKLALHDYLQRNHPNDTERLNMVYLHYNMFRQIGDALRGSAVSRLRAVIAAIAGGALGSGSTGWQLTGGAGALTSPYALFCASAATPAQVQQQQQLQQAAGANMGGVLEGLLAAQQLLCEAAESYLKEDCVSLARQCALVARLVGLQAQMPSVRVLGLADADVRKVAAGQHSRFADIQTVLQAYGKDTTGDWVAVIYQQSVLGGNLDLFKEYRRMYASTPSFFNDIVVKFKQDAAAARANVVENFRRLIEACPDASLKYRVAVEFRFADMAGALLAEFAAMEETL